MAKELVMVHDDRTVTQAIFDMRQQAQEVEHVYTVYVVDKDERFVGLLPLKDILFGLTRLVMLKHRINDIRKLHQSLVTIG